MGKTPITDRKERCMPDISVKADDIKNFIYKKEISDTGIRTRILGVTFEYVRSEHYRQLRFLLEFISQLTEDNLKLLIEHYRSKEKSHHLSASEYKKELQKVREIIKNINPNDLPCAGGEVRTYQLNLLNFAKEITADINIPFWLDGGSLLGAVRHKGFIPWDDDMDFALMREDYKKLTEHFKSKYRCIDTSKWILGHYTKNIKRCLREYPNEIFCFRHIDAFKVVKGTVDNFYVLDFFAWDYYNDFHNTATLKVYAAKMKDKMYSAKTYSEIFSVIEEEIKKGIDVVDSSDVISAGVDNHGFQTNMIKETVRYSDIFPLQKIKFEDYEFNAPNNAHNYLKSLYNFYNKLPLNPSIFLHVNTKRKWQV